MENILPQRGLGVVGRLEILDTFKKSQKGVDVEREEVYGPPPPPLSLSNTFQARPVSQSDGKCNQSSLIRPSPILISAKIHKIFVDIMIYFIYLQKLFLAILFKK